VNHTSRERTILPDGTELSLDPRFGTTAGMKNTSVDVGLLRAGVFLLTCLAFALLGALDEYFLWTNMKEFFAVHDIMHHEVIEVTVVAFGLGVFAKTLASRLNLHLGLLRNTILLQIPIPTLRGTSAHHSELGAEITSTGHPLRR
jgi:hypothetical protein